MELQRREVLKMLSAAPFFGLFGQSAYAKVSERRRKTKEKQVWRVFEEPFLSEIAFPLGGIGAGTVSLGGRGNLRDWEICNRPHKGRTLENTFFGLWYKEEGEPGKAYILESQIQPPFRGGFGLNRGELPGMPRFRKARFLGSYPFARLELEDEKVPLSVSLECFNPFIPNNDKDSSLPVAVFYWQVKNKSRKKIDLTVMASLLNIAGVDSFGKNLNQYADAGAFRGLKMTTQKYAADSPKYGDMALATMHKDVTYTTRWDRGGWFDAQSLFWNDFSEDGRLNPIDPSDPSPNNNTDTCSLGAVLSLQPGESATVPFLIAWHFPNRENYWNGEEAVKGKIVGNYYASQFKNAWEVVEYTTRNLHRLEQETRLFHEALFTSTLPEEVLDAVSSQASIIRTNTCFRTQDGKFFAFEGCSDNGGCCPLNCTHVWNYEQSLAHLFPKLEQTMRDTDFCFNTDEEGRMVFRTHIPLGLTKWDFPHPAADGQMGCIVKLYREWRLSGDVDFLKKMWPGAKRALEYAWKKWDPEKSGVMTEQQHNTYDIEFYGSNPMMGAIYLAALRAGEEMARALGDDAAADEYRKVFEKGRVRLERETWNGEYFIQVYDPNQHTKYQLGDGCLSDQLLGQWMAHVVDLGYLLPEDKVKSAIQAIYRSNFKETFTEHYNPQRIYALGDEAGLLLCSWPRGNRPALPFVYSDEVWTGIEYQVAAHLIYEGFIEEGLNIVRAVRNRYDGERRNPWNEVECGHHYARAMASWSVLTALSGFQFSAPQKGIAFTPVINQKKFSCFWSAGPGWGTYEQKSSSSRLQAKVNVLYGLLTLQTVSLPAPKTRKNTLKAEAAMGSKSWETTAAIEAGKAILSLPEPVDIPSGAALEIRLKA
ncbi:MAG: GH116 family glycosyl-hydrolase [Candidatus Omnitrophota bacterium]